MSLPPCWAKVGVGHRGAGRWLGEGSLQVWRSPTGGWEGGVGLELRDRRDGGDAGSPAGHRGRSACSLACLHNPHFRQFEQDGCKGYYSAKPALVREGILHTASVARSVGSLDTARGSASATRPARTGTGRDDVRDEAPTLRSAACPIQLLSYGGQWFWNRARGWLSPKPSG